MNENIKLDELLSCAFNERHNLPKFPSIYFVFSPNNKLQYIGATRKLKNRICVNDNIKKVLSEVKPQDITIKYFPITDIRELFRIESDCIRKFKPRLNRFNIKSSPIVTSIEKREKGKYTSFDALPIDNFYKSKMNNLNY